MTDIGSPNRDSCGRSWSLLPRWPVRPATFSLSSSSSRAATSRLRDGPATSDRAAVWLRDGAFKSDDASSQLHRPDTPLRFDPSVAMPRSTWSCIKYYTAASSLRPWQVVKKTPHMEPYRCRPWNMSQSHTVNGKHLQRLQEFRLDSLMCVKKKHLPAVADRFQKWSLRGACR